MSSEGTGVFTKENLDTLLKELAKEFKRQNGTAVPAEIILIGGAAILAGYGFREMTTDVDAVIHAISHEGSCKQDWRQIQPPPRMAEF